MCIFSRRFFIGQFENNFELLNALIDEVSLVCGQHTIGIPSGDFPHLGRYSSMSAAQGLLHSSIFSQTPSRCVPLLKQCSPGYTQKNIFKKNIPIRKHHFTGTFDLFDTLNRINELNANNENSQQYQRILNEHLEC